MFKIYSLLPRLASYSGHEYAYHRSLEEGLVQIGWECFFLYPKGADIAPPNPNWLSFLANDLSPHPKGIFSKLSIFFANISPFRRIFQMCREEKTTAIFIEQFELSHLASIFAALLFIKPRFHFWILHHYPLEEASLKTKICRRLYDRIEKKMGPGKFRCLTDSELIEIKNEQGLKRPCKTVPIPHTTYRDVKKIKSEEIFVWLPGNAIRFDKGFKIVQEFSKKIKSLPHIKLALSENAREFLQESKELVFLPNYLAPKEYEAQMDRADLIFLPYDSLEFACRTSGIFVEAICAGVIPVVTKGTWMAYELEKFSLSALTFSWQEADLLERLISLFSDEKTMLQLSFMREKYRAYHCRKNMAQILQQFITGS